MNERKPLTAGWPEIFKESADERNILVAELPSGGQVEYAVQKESDLTPPITGFIV